VVVVDWVPRNVDCNSLSHTIANSQISFTLRYAPVSQLNDYSTRDYNFIGFFDTKQVRVDLKYLIMLYSLQRSVPRHLLISQLKHLANETGRLLIFFVGELQLRRKHLDTISAYAPLLSSFRITLPFHNQLAVVVDWVPRNVNWTSSTRGIANSRNSPILRHTLASQLNDYSTRVYNFNNLLVFRHKGGKS
jgi:hypothetical protein